MIGTWLDARLAERSPGRERNLVVHVPGAPAAAPTGTGPRPIARITRRLPPRPLPRPANAVSC